MPHLIGPDLRINIEFGHEARMRPRHHLEVDPPKPHAFELRFEVPAPKVVFQNWGSALLRWKHPRIRPGIGEHIEPLLNQSGDTVPERRPTIRVETFSEPRGSPENRPVVDQKNQDIDPDGRISSVLVSNVLKQESRHQVIALGRLGWSLRRIQKETGVRRETISAYLKNAGVQLRPHAPDSCGQNRPVVPTG